MNEYRNKYKQHKQRSKQTNKSTAKTTTTTTKNKTKANLLTMYEHMTLILTVNGQYIFTHPGFDSTIISFYTFIWVISLTTGKMVTDLARVKYLEIDGTFNVKIQLVSNITP